jgi:hypothetical protein
MAKKDGLQQKYGENLLKKEEITGLSSPISQIRLKKDKSLKLKKLTDEEILKIKKWLKTQYRK